MDLALTPPSSDLTPDRYGFVTKTRSSLPAFVLLAAALLGAGRSAMLRDPGTFWHTAVGRHILDTRTLPTQDVLTYSHPGQPWIAQQWLAECTMAVLHRVGQWDALVLSACVLLAATYAAAYARLRRAGITGPWATVLVALVIAVSSQHFLVRPHLVTIALSYWLYAILCDLDAGRRALRTWLLLPVMFVWWSNLHGGALGGLFTLALTAAAWLLQHALTRFDRRDDPHTDEPPAGRRVGRSAASAACRHWLLPILSLAACFLAPFVNPYGPALVRNWLALLRSPVLPTLIQEHAPPMPTEMGFWMLTALVLAYLASLAAIPWRRMRCVWLVPLAWAALSYLRVRHGPIFAVMAAAACAQMLPQSRWRHAVTGPAGADACVGGSTPRRAATACAATLTLLLGFCLQTHRIPLPLVGANWAKLDSTYWPVAAVERLRVWTRNGPPGQRVFNEMLFGGYLIHELPDTLVYIDDRCELLGDAGLLEYVRMQAAPSSIRAHLKKDDVAYAVLRSGSSLDRAFAGWPEWRCEFRDGTAALYRSSRAAQVVRAAGSQSRAANGR